VTDILDELQWRGLIAQHTDIDALRAALSDGAVTFYCGFDPTAPSLHHGHLVAVKVMRHLQLAGHRPLALVGGATGLIGDPRAKGERSLNTKDVVAGWAASLQEQLENLLDFSGDNPAQIVNNLDWTQAMSAIDFLRDLGKHFRMGTMLSKDIVARRLASEEGISYTEFSYQVLQANDYLELYRRYGCTLEIGGNDQWGNLVGGMDLIHKVEGASVHVMTNPLITKADGTKFGKSEGGAIWLNPEMLSPYAFYQFWLQVDDADVVRFLKVFTFLEREEIERLEAATAENPKAREAHRALAHGPTPVPCCTSPSRHRKVDQYSRSHEVTRDRGCVRRFLPRPRRAAAVAGPGASSGAVRPGRGLPRLPCHAQAAQSGLLPGLVRLRPGLPQVRRSAASPSTGAHRTWHRVRLDPVAVHRLGVQPLHHSQRLRTLRHRDAVDSHLRPESVPRLAP